MRFVDAAFALATGLGYAAQVEAQLNAMDSVSTSDSGGGGNIMGYAYGGYVGGNRHSQGGTIIEAEKGEFVMSRAAVQSIGLENLNQMNLTGGSTTEGVTVNISGNVMTQEFVEGELLEAIEEAVRRGNDFGA